MAHSEEAGEARQCLTDSTAQLAGQQKAGTHAAEPAS